MQEQDVNYFGDKISTVDKKGRRKWIYAFQPKGKLYNYRTYLSILYLALFFTLPFIKWNGYPLFLFNIPEGIFILFGQVFLPQDFILLGVGMLTALLFIIVFTLLFGRVFCGWMCPQTIFMEMVFRRIEYWIEGSAQKQKNADSKKWTTEMYIRKGIKHLIFLLISFLIANVFLSYIIGVEALFKIMTDPVSEHIVGLISLVLFTLVFYAVFAFVRELVCTVICPYGRLQGVMMDKNSIAVAYDYNRGEPRGKRKRGVDKPLGDCIDCGLCVNVCPTGIDIRNGLQLECTNCTACIDACNLMMKKVNKPPHLIKFASEAQLEANQKQGVNYRTKIYMGVLVVLLVAFVSMLATRSIFDATVLRVGGQLMQENADGTINNLYRIKLVSKSMKTEPYHLKMKEPYASVIYVGKKLDSLNTGVHVEETFFVNVPKDKLEGRKNKLHLQVMSGEKVVQTQEISFLGNY